MNILKKLLTFTPPIRENNFNLTQERNETVYDVRRCKEPHKDVLIYGEYDKDSAYVKNRFSVPLNNDVVVREFKMREGRRALVVFIEGMVDTSVVDEGIVKTMLLMPYYKDGELYIEESEIADYFIGHAQATLTDSFDKIFEEVNFGGCAVIIDGFKQGIVCDVRKWGTRAISKPENEQSIYGPQEAFGEMLRNNTALVRKIIKTEKLIAEGVKIGTVSKTRGVLLYINDIANTNLVDEVRKRINSIGVDYIMAIEEVALLLEENSIIMTSQIIYTERPDRVARALTEGKVVLQLNGSPNSLIFPTTAFEMLHAASDDYLRLPYANMSMLIRLAALSSSILLPGIYLAVTLFHHEIIPTYLLYSISAARENVPFPSIIELLLMDISFELIREAGIRMPSPIGSTLGIVGGLILGQSAVSAKIVSPLMIIVIAITGIGSFATPDYSLSWTSRILRLGFIFLAAFFGLYGIAIGIFLYSLLLAEKKSFGVPFLSPIPGSGKRYMKNAIFENPIWRRELRPEFLKTKRKRAEEKVSRNWNIKRK